jgi:hypothetical protein
LSQSALVASNITLTTLLDTVYTLLGLQIRFIVLNIQDNSLICGSKDILDAITMQLGGDTFDYAEAHMLAFQIGGFFFFFFFLENALNKY